MLKSLFSGVSGLQSHQVAMDVESNNIANVNTIGFKYSRANFSDLLAQTNQIATAPQGQLGGKNAVQVGLGATVASVTRIHTQGSIQNSDKNTDIAIQGDGFYIVSPDAGNTYKYTRSGDFKFDANGNFVDNNGFVAQGWLRDDTTNLVDNTSPIQNIVIPPGLTTPASATEIINLKANLNSGSVVTQFSPTFALDSSVLTTETTEDFGVLFDSTGRAYDLQTGQGMWVGFEDSISSGAAIAGGALPALNAGDFILNGTSITLAATPATNTATDNAQALISAINGQTANTGITATLLAGTTDQIELTNNNRTGTTTATKNIIITGASAGTAGFVAGGADDSITSYEYTYNPISGVPALRSFRTTEDLRNLLMTDANAVSSTALVTIGDDGKFAIDNTSTAVGSSAMNISVTGLSTATVLENNFFAPNFQSLQGSLQTGVGQVRRSQPSNAATHSSSLDVFDSLGSKHTVALEFRKTQQTTATGSIWEYTITVPQPATILGAVAPDTNVLTGGNVTFNSEGAIVGVNPGSFDMIPGNGSSSPQTIDLDFGTFNGFDGLTSFDSSSATSGLSQDGYPGGDLVGIRIDQSGTLIGSFSNGRSFGLAQIAMAKFVNNEGLAADGGNVYLQSANSGDPIIGTAATGGRGFIQSSALEASNVDLSRSLTQLIIIQRGYQANGKTITTSDTLLETLIGLKR
jgi:flagellar hook protein FlgE